MFGGAVVLAALVAGAEPEVAVVHGEVGAVRAAQPAAGSPSATATATPTANGAITVGAANPAANPAATPTAARMADPTTSTSTSTSTTTTTTTTTTTNGAANGAANAGATPPAPVETAAEEKPAPAAPAVKAPPLGAAPAGAPLADSVPILLARRAWTDGGAIERLIEPSGDVVVHAVTPAGTVLSCTKVGSLFALPLVSQADAAGGEVVQVARDDSGALVRWVVQADGEPRAVTVIEPAPLASR